MSHGHSFFNIVRDVLGSVVRLAKRLPVPADNIVDIDAYKTISKALEEIMPALFLEQMKYIDLEGRGVLWQPLRRTQELEGMLESTCSTKARKH